MIRSFGDRWLNSKFASRLEALKHEQAKETEHLRFTINRQLDRVTKLNQLEMEALPALWAELMDAVSATRAAYYGFRQHADFSVLSDVKAAEILSRSGLPEHHQAEILAAERSERNRVFGRAETIKEILDAKMKVHAANTTLKKSGIFLPDDLLTKLRELSDLAWGAIVDTEIVALDRLPRGRDDRAEKLRVKGDELIAELEGMVRVRLRDSEKL